jgi:carbon-monoxide dehydrogenase medium subunit
MYPPQFDYVKAGSVNEAISLLGQNPDAKLLAGGHSLIPLLKLRHARPAMLIDIGRIVDLKGTRKTNGTVHIGALTSHAMLADSKNIPSALSEAAGIVADLQVRNRGTIGGNVAHADPGSDLPTVLTALGATFQAKGPSGERSIQAEDFFKGWFETALRENEILTAVVVPAHGRSTGSAYTKMINPASGYAMLGAAAIVTLAGGRCTAASVALGGLTPKPIKASSVESALVGRVLDDATISAACQAVLDDLVGDLLGDIHAGADYRKAMAPLYTKRALKAAVERSGS